PPELAFHNFKVFEGKNAANPTPIKGQYPLWSIRRVQMLLLGLRHPTLPRGKCYRRCRVAIIQQLNVFSMCDVPGCAAASKFDPTSEIGRFSTTILHDPHPKV